MRPSDKRSILSVDCAVRRYAGSVRQGSVPCRADGDAAGQTENFRDAAERSELRYEQMKRLLCDLGVSTVQFVAFRSFTLHVDKLCRDYSEESLRMQVSDAIQRWTRYGCSPEVLKAVCRKVFDLEVD